MSGRYFDEWQVGDRIEHPIRCTVTETDNLLFSTMTHNPQPLHIDVEASSRYYSVCSLAFDGKQHLPRLLSTGQLH